VDRGQNEEIETTERAAGANNETTARRTSKRVPRKAVAQQVADDAEIPRSVRATTEETTARGADKIALPRTALNPNGERR
jgi:hypothetical protein